MNETPQPKPGNTLLTSMVSLMILSWVFNFIFAKLALRSFDPLTLAAFRVVLATIVMVAVYLSLPKGLHTAIAGPNRPTKPSRSDLWTFAELGILGVILNQMLFTVGLSQTSVGHSALIVGMGPIHVLIFARLFGLEQITSRKLIGLLLAFTGVVVLALEKGLSLQAGTLRGDLITWFGSLAFSLYTVRGKRVAAKYDSLAMNLYNYLAGGLVILPLAIWLGWRLDWGSVTWTGWVGLAYMSIFASVTAYLIFYWALRHMTATRLAAFSYLMPVIATLMGILLLGEKVTWHLLVGGTLVLIGVYLKERKTALPREDTQAVVSQQS